MLKALLHVGLQITVAAARIAIMAVVAALTLIGRLLASAISALWRQRQASVSGAAEPEPGTPGIEPRIQARRPRPFNF